MEFWRHDVPGGLVSQHPEICSCAKKTCYRWETSTIIETICAQFQRTNLRFLYGPKSYVTDKIQLSFVYITSSMPVHQS